MSDHPDHANLDERKRLNTYRITFHSPNPEHPGFHEDVEATDEVRALAYALDLNWDKGGSPTWVGCQTLPCGHQNRGTYITVEMTAMGGYSHRMAPYLDPKDLPEGFEMDQPEDKT